MFNIPTEISSTIHAYSSVAFENDISGLQRNWKRLQKCRDRDGIYEFLSEVFNLVAWWLADKKALRRSTERFARQGIHPVLDLEPFAAAIIAAATPTDVDKRTVSKWSRVLRYAYQFKPPSESLKKFVKRNGGLNKCATLYAHRLGRLRR